jgi:hypothetical protein
MEALQLARIIAHSHISLPGYLLSARGSSTSVSDITRKSNSRVVVHSNKGSTRGVSNLHEVTQCDLNKKEW